MDNEYGTMFKQLMNERNELRKYIIDICKLLGIDTSQSILGANCLEFYAVLCSTAENKIEDLQEQLKRKEQEYEDLRQYHNKCCEEFKKEKQDLIDKYNQLSINFYNGDYCNTEYCSLLKSKEEELQTQRNFTAQEQRKIYCVAYDETCETGNECKQKKCAFKDRLKYKQALDEIEKYLDAQQKYFDGEDYHNLLDIINKVKE